MIEKLNDVEARELSAELINMHRCIWGRVYEGPGPEACPAVHSGLLFHPDNPITSKAT